MHFAPHSKSDIANSPLYSINSVLAQAEQRIYLAQFSFTAQLLANTMEERHIDGIEVKGLGDSSFFGRYYSEFLDMLGQQELNTSGEYEVDSVTDHSNNPWESPAGVRVAYCQPGDKFHHKYWVVDKMVITGSMNASASGATSNDENIVIIYSSGAAEAFSSEFLCRFSESY